MVWGIHRQRETYKDLHDFGGKDHVRQRKPQDSTGVVCLKPVLRSTVSGKPVMGTCIINGLYDGHEFWEITSNGTIRGSPRTSAKTVTLVQWFRRGTDGLTKPWGRRAVWIPIGKSGGKRPCWEVCMDHGKRL